MSRAAEVDLRKEVFAWFGSSAYAAQCLEMELLILLLCVERLRTPSLTGEELEEIDCKLSKRTLGQLLGELRSRLVLHPDFERLLNSYLARRNYLAHRFFSHNATKLLSRSGCEEMITELMRIYSTMREADDVVKTMSANVRNHLGISEEEIQRLVSEELHRSAAIMPDETL
jgi:hypothetical protein